MKQHSTSLPDLTEQTLFFPPKRSKSQLDVLTDQLQYEHPEPHQAMAGLGMEDEFFLVDPFTNHHPFMTMSSGSDFHVPHKCPESPDLDPLSGIFKIPTPCCSMQAYIALPSDLEPSDIRKKLTKFGQKLHLFDVLFEIQLDNVAADYWMVTDQPIDREVFEGLLQATVNHFDEDKVQWKFESCSICYAECRFVRKPPCCRQSICQSCWQQYIKAHCNQLSFLLSKKQRYDLRCYSCNKLVPYTEALGCSEPEDIDRIRPKTLKEHWASRCPNCLQEVEDKSAYNVKLKSVKGGLPYSCSRCDFEFCRLCGTSKHPKASCDQIIKTEVGLTRWSKQKGQYQNPYFRNGRTCPFCGVMLSHAGGCPHMICPCCRHEFCYSCGRKYYKLPFLRSHSATKMLPFLSCPRRWNSKRKRLAVHSLITLGFSLTAGPFLLTIAPIAMPAALVYYLVKRHRRKKNKKHLFTI